MSEAKTLPAEAINAYYTKPYYNKDIMPDGSVEVGQPEWNIGSVIDAKFQALIMPLIQKREHPVEAFPLEEKDIEKKSQIAQAFNTIQQRLFVARNDPSQSPAADEVVRAYEDMYFMLTPITPANRYLRELIDEGVSVLGLPRLSLPRQAYIGESIAEERLAVYHTTEYANYDTLETGLRPAKKPARTLRDLMHAKSCGGALPFNDGLPMCFKYGAEKWPIVENTTMEQAQRIAGRFLATEAVLGAACNKHMLPPSKEWVEKAFSDFHNMLLPVTPENRYIRTLIEKALDAMGLDDSLLDARSAAQFTEDERAIAKVNSIGQTP